MAEKTITQLRVDTPSITIGGNDLVMLDQSAISVAAKLSEIKTFVKPSDATATIGGLLTNAQAVKLDGIATGATQNSLDSALLNRANHTGTQAVASITGLVDSLNSRQFASTTILSGLAITPGTPVGRIDISAGSAVFVDHSTPKSPVASVVDFTAFSSIVLTGLATNKLTYVGIDKNGNIVQQLQKFTNVQKSTIADLGCVVHTNNTSIRYIWPGNTSFGNGILRIVDSVSKPKIVSGGKIDVSAALTISKSSVVLQSLGQLTGQSNFGAEATANLTYFKRDGVQFTPQTNIDPSSYDLAGVKTPSTVGKWSIQNLYLMPNGTISVLYGQIEYNDQLLALNALDDTVVIPDELFEFGVLIGKLVVKQGATALNNKEQAFLIRESEFVLTQSLVSLALGYTPANPDVPFIPKSYTLATLPIAANFNNRIILVSDATGGAKLCISNGTDWKILNTSTTVS